MRGLELRTHLKGRVFPRRWIAGSSPAITDPAFIKDETKLIQLCRRQRPACIARNTSSLGQQSTLRPAFF